MDFVVSDSLHPLPDQPILGAVIGAAFDDVLAAAQGGDEDAFRCLWDDVNPALVRYLGVFAARDAEDVAAETWLTVIRGLREFRGDEQGFRAWVFTTARRRTFDESRRRLRREALDGNLWSSATGLAGADPADLVPEQLETRRLLGLIARLPRKQAEIVVLRVVAGLSVNDVATLVGCSPGAVRVNAHRGLKRLAADLAREGVTL